MRCPDCVTRTRRPAPSCHAWCWRAERSTRRDGGSAGRGARGAAESGVEERRAAAEEPERALALGREADAAARAPRKEADAGGAKLRGEIRALRELLAAGRGGKSPPLLDSLRVAAGY